MFSESTIPTETIRAYLATHYCVHVETPFVLKIAQRSTDLAHAYQQLGVNSAAFITAWNPFSQRSTDAENNLAQSILVEDINQRGLRYVPGEGLDSEGTWLGEPSILVFDLSRESSKTIGVKYKQNGLVWIGADAVPQLILLR